MRKNLIEVELPFCGFYETQLQDWADQPTYYLDPDAEDAGCESQYEHGDYQDQDFGIYYRKVAIHYGQALLKEIEIVLGVKVTNSEWDYVPTKDNFSSPDRLFFKTSKTVLRKLYRKADKEKLRAAFEYAGTSRDGYMPLIAPEIPDQPVEKWSVAKLGLLMGVLIEQAYGIDDCYATVYDAEDMACNGVMDKLYYEALLESRAAYQLHLTQCDTQRCTHQAKWQITIPYQTAPFKACQGCMLKIAANKPETKFEVFEKVEPRTESMYWREGVSRSFDYDGQNTYSITHKGQGRLALFYGNGYSLENEALIEAVNKLFDLNIKNSGSSIEKQMAAQGVEVEYHKRSKTIYATYPSTNGGVKTYA